MGKELAVTNLQRMVGNQLRVKAAMRNIEVSH